MSAPTIASITLPAGFTLLPEGTIMEHFVDGSRRPRLDLRLRDVIDRVGVEPTEGASGYSLYGGATVSEVWDAANTRYTGCDARDSSGWFGWHVFGDKGMGLYNIPLQARPTGRGTVNPNAYSRIGEWIAWEGSIFYRNVIPGFVPFPLASGAGWIAPPQGYYRIFAEQNGFSGDRVIDLAPLGVPAATAVSIEIAIDGSAAGLELACGPLVGDPNFQAASMIEARTVVPGLRAKASGVVGAHSGKLLVRASGHIDRGFVDVLLSQ